VRTPASAPAEVATPPDATATPAPSPGVTGHALNPPRKAAQSLPPGFQPREGTTTDPSGWPREIVCERDGSTMLLVPAGRFLMGDDRGAPAERPEHEVGLSTYYVDQHEITNRQYYDLYLASSAKAVPPKDAPIDDRPVVGVSLDDATAYAAWAGKTLPTEAQWEKAARGNDGRPYPWGPSAPRWESKREPRQIDPVGSFPSDVSPYGALDVCGNAWEWTSDWFEAGAFERFAEAPTADPSGPERPRSRIAEVTVKGGASDWKVAWRSGMRPEATLPYLGFRCVLRVADDAPRPKAPRKPAGPRFSPGATGEPVPF
jgi:formylglycine-generating enzyme required for sulfatase activity